MISVVIPAFNEQENIPAAAERLGGILAPLSDYELIFVDDGSKDGTWELIKQDRKSTRLNSSHRSQSRMPSSA